jgi:hypothetical protein
MGGKTNVQDEKKVVGRPYVVSYNFVKYERFQNFLVNLHKISHTVL